MSGNSFDFTPQQKAAIESRGGALLVSAAAGSGKTKVLVERLLGYITDETTNCNLSEFLVITYTRAAANELKAKILDEISARLALAPENAHLRRQSALCYNAQIGTIHGFCTELLRENAHLLEITPDFRVADENESSILKAKVLEELLDSRYETIDNNPGFALLVDSMSAGRDDKRLVEVILDAHSKLKSHAAPEKWVLEQLKIVEKMATISEVSKTLWGRYLMADAQRKAVYWHNVMQQLLSEASDCPDFYKAYGDSIVASIEGLSAFKHALDTGWDEARILSSIPFPRAKNIKNYEELKEIRTRCRDAMKKVGTIFECASVDLLEDMTAVQPAVSELLQLVLEFDNHYGAAKKKRGVVDFSDQEHLAMRLLANPETGEQSELGCSVAGRYKEIMVDEYQDVSGVQEIIFRAVSKGSTNIFMVGDVKQSIYRFRLADPSIFLDKYKSYRDETAAEPGEGRRVLLSTNFRSRAGILSAVNFIFKNVMSEEFGEMDYTETEFLYPGRIDKDTTEPAVEINVLDMSTIETDDDEESPEKMQTEADFIAKRIQEMKDSGLHIPAGPTGARAAAYGDFVILLRSMKDKAAVYAQALTSRGIPVSMGGGEGFFYTMEVSVTLSLLGIIDNPMQDIPLIAVLKSPLYSFTPDELASIRASDKKDAFFTALSKAAETDEKCQKFLADLHAFRTAAPDMSSDRLIWHVYNEIDMLAIMGALRGGQERRKNLMRLAELAGRYETNGYKGLFGFISFIRKLIENGSEPGDTNEALSGEGVRIMSIHKSKGLEFPVVFIADTAKKFNVKDLSKPLLMHAALGVGMKRTDTKRRIEYATLPRMAVAKKLAREMMSEELRVLYVAMTRAREKLVIVATFADARRELSKLSKEATSPMAPQVLEGLGRLAGFILAPTLTRPEAACLRQDPIALAADDNEIWDIRLISAGVPENVSHVTSEPEIARAEATPAEVEALRTRLKYVYPYTQSYRLPSKLTATELKGRLKDYESQEDAKPPEFNKDQNRPAARPHFITEQTTLSASERGTALHLAMQFIDYDRCTDTAAVIQELQYLEDKGFLTKMQRAAVEPTRISTFFASPLGQRILQSKELYREFKFSLLVKAGAYYEGAGEDDILFQGVIDCCFEENGALHIVDFKTDATTEKTVEEKKLQYTEQLSAYGRAMERITGKPVGSLLLYLFALGKTIEI